MARVRAISRPVVALPAAVFALALLAGPAAGQSTPAAPRITPRQASVELDAIINDVVQARTQLTQVRDAALRSRLEVGLLRAEANARALRGKLVDAANAAAANAANAPPAVISADAFAEFQAVFRKEAFDAGRVRLIQDFAGSHRFRAEQAAALLKGFSFDEGRLKAVAALYPRLVDPGDFYKLLDTFTFDNNKKAARTAVGLR